MYSKPITKRNQKAGSATAEAEAAVTTTAAAAAAAGKTTGLRCRANCQQQ